MAITYTSDFKGQANDVSATITSNALTVATGDFLTVVVSYENNPSSTAWTVSNTGTAITWTKQAETNTASNCKVVLWTGTAGATPPTTVSVQSTAGVFTDSSRAMFTAVHTGAHATTPLPAGNIFSGVGGTDVTQLITPTSSGSALWMVAGDWGATNSFAAAANCTLAATAYHETGIQTVVPIRPTTQPRTNAAAFTIGETDTAGTIAWIAFEVQAEPGTDVPLKRNLPAFVAKGAFSGSAAAPTPGMPVFNEGDLLVVSIESANQAITTPTDYTQFANSPQSTGTAATAGGVRLAAFWKIAVAGDTAPTIVDTVNHTCAQIYSIRGIDSGNPVNITAGQTQAATTAVSFPSVTTTVDNCLILNLMANDRDAASTANISAQANAALASLTVQHDETITAGVGGGLCTITGIKAAAGVVGNTTATNAASVTNATLTIALQGSPKIPDWTITQKFTPLRM